MESQYKSIIYFYINSQISLNQYVYILHKRNMSVTRMLNKIAIFLEFYIICTFNYNSQYDWNQSF